MIIPAPLLLGLALAGLLNQAAAGDIDVLAPGRTFAPPAADPRWPRFAAGWQEYQDDPFLDSVAAVALGGDIAVLRATPADDHDPPQWEIGLQTGVFASFEPLESSQDLFNSDWQFGIYGARRAGDWSGILRLWHQSSHLGDEFLLRNPGFRRVNFTFESLSGLVAWEPARWARFYGGGGWIFDENPAAFGNWFVQYGLELRPPVSVFGGRARPFAAVDVQHYEATDWQADVSVVAGLDLGRPARDDMSFSLVIELYDGRNPNGQFFTEDARYIGAGIRLRL